MGIGNTGSNLHSHCCTVRFCVKYLGRLQIKSDRSPPPQFVALSSFLDTACWHNGMGFSSPQLANRPEVGIAARTWLRSIGLAAYPSLAGQSAKREAPRMPFRLVRKQSSLLYRRPPSSLIPDARIHRDFATAGRWRWTC